MKQLARNLPNQKKNKDCTQHVVSLIVKQVIYNSVCTSLHIFYVRNLKSGSFQKEIIERPQRCQLNIHSDSIPVLSEICLVVSPMVDSDPNHSSSRSMFMRVEVKGYLNLEWLHRLSAKCQGCECGQLLIYYLRELSQTTGSLYPIGLRR